jgi:hypothetical protein
MYLVCVALNLFLVTSIIIKVLNNEYGVIFGWTMYVPEENTEIVSSILLGALPALWIFSLLGSVVTLIFLAVFIIYFGDL